MCTPTQGVWQPAGCVSCELVCVCVSLVRVVIICPASTHTALVSSPSLAVLHLTTYLPNDRLALPALSFYATCAPAAPLLAPRRTVAGVNADAATAAAVAALTTPRLCRFVREQHRADAQRGP